MDEQLPEQEHYTDDGCDLFPSCLVCPLPRCRHDNPGRQTAKELRNGDMARLHGEGLSITELSRRFGVSKRTVCRALQRSNGKVEETEGAAHAPPTRESG